MIYRIRLKGAIRKRRKVYYMGIDQTFLDELSQDMRDNGVDDEMFISETIAAMNNYPYDYPYQENKEQCPPIK